MNHISKCICRLVQMGFRFAMPFLPYREPKRYKNIADIPKVLQEKGIKSVLLITDSGLRMNIGLLKLENACWEKGIHLAIYDETKANPTVQNVEEARRLYIRNGCKALIAFGGGSSIDCAKAVGARLVYPNKSVSQLKGLLRVWKKLPLLIAIPTTAGTGSEVTVTAVITDQKKKHKYTMNNFTMIPSVAVLDPEVTYSLPSHLTATTGMDALTHVVEAYIGGSTTKETRRLSLEAARLIFANIETAYHKPMNYEARKFMLLAAYKAGLAFSKSYVGYIHAVAHSLGGQYNIAHGLANAVLMPIVLEAYGEAAHKRLYELGVAVGVAKTNDSPAEGARKFIEAIRELNARMGIPEKLKGIKEEDIEKMAKYAAKEANPLYPVPKLMSAKELEQFYYQVADYDNRDVKY